MGAAVPNLVPLNASGLGGIALTASAVPPNIVFQIAAVRLGISFFGLGMFGGVLGAAYALAVLRRARRSEAR